MTDCCQDHQMYDHHRENGEKNSRYQNTKNILGIKFPTWLLIGAAILAYFFFNQRYQIDLQVKPKTNAVNTSTSQPTDSLSISQPTIGIQTLAKEVLPSEGVELPIKWGNLGQQMVQAGVIDPDKFRQLFGGQLTEDQEAMLTGTYDQAVKIDQQNSHFLLDLLWALGLGNKNSILTAGEMANPQYGGAGNFASTGGWTLAKGKPMDHYSQHPFITLTSEQQELVEQVSQNIYRPCCGNSAHFPDCNHGMAMFGLLELMASQGATEEQMYRTALAVNSYWFPQTYLDLATYFQEQGQSWNQVSPQLALGQLYSSGQGYANTRRQIKSLPQPQNSGGGCSV